VSTTQILAELPKLSDTELHKVARRVKQLEAEREAMEFAEASLLMACQEMDHREAEGAKGKSKAR
jgi:hypothetical protein